MSRKLIEKILSDSASPEERQQFEEWLNASSKNRNYFNKARVIWDSLEGAFQTKKFEKQTAQTKIELRISATNAKVTRLKRYRQLAYAASVLILLGLSFLIWNKVNQGNRFDKVYSANNSVLEVELEDGSHVWLNKNSTLELTENFSQKDRTVNLKGEAYFEVKSDETKPFKVLAGKTVTKVLGTSFNLETDSITGNVNLNVNSGKVAFLRKNRKKNEYYLTNGAYARYIESENRIQVGRNENLNYLAWKTGRLRFYDTPIDQVCKELSKYYGARIETELGDGAILTGTFDNEELENVLAIIEISLGLEIHQDNGVYTISR
ncbi:MAG: FecR domain-containing protein [Prolixibacteraceae bacterium]|nr:FecR domain-containing protein [Prolixibacteraceae bacterium]